MMVRLTLAALLLAAMIPSPAVAQTIATRRLPASLANEAVAAAVASCVAKGLWASAVVVDVDGVSQATLRGDGAGPHNFDGAHDKAYTAVSFKQDTSKILAGIAAGTALPPSLARLPHLFAASGGVVIKIGDEVIGAIGVGAGPVPVPPGGEEACAKAGIQKIQDRLK